MLESCGINHNEQADIELVIEPGKAGIKTNNNIVFCDFNDSWHQNITYTIKLDNCALARAIGLYQGIKVLDATAGLGRDAFTLAVLKADIFAIEKHPLLAFMLMYAAKDMANIKVKNTNYANVVGIESWDCIYFDFMFAKKSRTAKANQGMELIASLAEPEILSEEIWFKAIQTCKKVVVKRPKSQKVLPIACANLKPNHTISTKNISFDVFIGKLP